MTCKINLSTSTGLELESDTSGIVDIQSNGTTKMTVGTTIDIQGNELVLDADADTSIHADTDDQIDFKVGGTDKAQIDSSGNLKFDSGLGSVQTAYGVRAWVFFDGTGTVSIYDSGNVSSITDYGTGVYGVNFSTAMPDTNYCPVGIAQRDSTSNSDCNVSERHNYTRSTTNVRFDVRIASNGASHDSERVSIMVAR